jgi:ribonuclease J
LPPLEGLYRKDHIQIFNENGANFPLHQKALFDAIFLSHAHADHFSYISFIDPDIPIYTTLVTKTLVEIFDKITTEGIENEVYDFAPRDLQTKKKSKQKITRKFVTVEPFKKQKIKNLEFVFLPVAHSIPGASMMLFYTSGGKLLYSGDFKIQGWDKELTLRTIDFLKREGVDLMLCEGTRIKSKQIITEEQVHNDIETIFKKVHQGVIFIEYSYRDINRFETIAKIAKRYNRILAIPPEWYYYLKELKQRGFIGEIFNKNSVKLLGRRKITTRGVWEKTLLQEEETVSPFFIAKNQDKFAVGLSFFKLPDLIDIQPQKGSAYIQSTSEPFNEEMEIDLIRLKNWLNHFKIEIFEKPHASGHISGVELEKVIKEINPQKLIPIHTDYPQYFKKFHKNVLIIQSNKTYIF